MRNILVRGLRISAVLMVLALSVEIAGAQTRSRHAILQENVVFDSHVRGPMEALQQAGLSVNYLPHVRCDATGELIRPSEYTRITCRQLRVNAGSRPNARRTRQLIVQELKAEQRRQEAQEVAKTKAAAVPAPSPSPLAVVVQNYAELSPLIRPVGSQTNLRFQVFYSDGTVKAEQPIVEVVPVDPPAPTQVHVVRVTPRSGLAEIEAVHQGSAKLILWSPGKTQRSEVTVVVPPPRPSSAFRRYTEFTAGDWIILILLICIGLGLLALLVLTRADRQFKAWRARRKRRMLKEEARYKLDLD